MLACLLAKSVICWAHKCFFEENMNELNCPLTFPGRDSQRLCDQRSRWRRSLEAGPSRLQRERRGADQPEVAQRAPAENFQPPRRHLSVPVRPGLQGVERLGPRRVQLAEG